MGEFIKKKFFGQEICVWLGETAETVTYNQFWLNNTGFFKGFVIDVDEDILTLDVPEVGEIYIDCGCGNIKAVWRPSFNFHKAVETALTNKMFGSRKYNK